MDQVGAATFVSKFDLLKGYWQVPLSKRAHEMPLFVTPSGLFSYTVMPFGLRNAPATFQRLMNLVVGDMPGCVVYLDDVVVYSDTWDEHLQHIAELFKRLKAAGLSINLTKCGKAFWECWEGNFGKATVVYNGHVVGQGCIRPVQAKVEAVQTFPVPQMKRELMHFLGLVGYYRAFCRNFSDVVAPLTDLLKKHVRFVWSESCQSAFD